MGANEVRIAIVGLGRLGQRHATNLAFRVKDSKLVAAYSIVPEERALALSDLAVEKVYGDFDAMLDHPHMDAVLMYSAKSP